MAIRVEVRVKGVIRRVVPLLCYKSCFMGKEKLALYMSDNWAQSQIVSHHLPACQSEGKLTQSLGIPEDAFSFA